MFAIQECLLFEGSRGWTEAGTERKEEARGARGRRQNKTHTQGRQREDSKKGKRGTCVP